MTDRDLLELRIGEKLGEMRLARGLTLSQLAARAGIGEERIRAFEAGTEMPAVGDLVRLADALDVRIGHFFLRQLTGQRVEVVRAADRWTVQAPSEAGRTLNYRYQSLSYNLTEKLMAPFLVEIPPDRTESPPTSSHQGEEFLFVLAGQLEVRVGDEVHRLAPGDSIYFDSRQEHALRAVEGATARVLACVAQDRKREAEDGIPRSYGSE